VSELEGRTLAWGKSNDEPVVSVLWSDKLEVQAKDGSTIIGRGWDLHPRERWESGADWAVVDAVWGVEKGSSILDSPDLQPGQRLVLKVGRPDTGRVLEVWDAAESTRVGLVPEPYATELREWMTRGRPVHSLCTWQWRDVSGKVRTIRSLYATSAPEFLPPAR